MYMYLNARHVKNECQDSGIHFSIKKHKNKIHMHTDSIVFFLMILIFFTLCFVIPYGIFLKEIL